MNDYADLMKIVESREFSSMIGDSQIASVQCFQFGDSGKGKIAALLALWADFTGRGTGTSNAGHTSYIKHLDQLIKVITHFIPSSIFYDHLGKVTILGSGMGINLEELLGEMDGLEKADVTFDNMMISKDASLILPYHVMKDHGNKSMKPGSASSTGKGTTPVYTDKVGRLGIFFRDLFNVDIFRKKLEKAQKEHSQLEINVDDTIERHREMFERVKHMVRDTRAYTHAQLAQGKKMLIEGAQGTLLSIQYGTYGYCTSSDPSVYGSAIGCDIKPEDIDLILGLVKFPIMTRVGNGPFPSEFGGRRSEEYCAEDDGNAHKKHIEEEKFSSSTPRDMIICKDEFLAGVGWRRLMDEYGATSARPRRTGKVDAVAGKYAVEVNSGRSKYLPGVSKSKRRILLVSTKSDCAANMGDIEICTAYEYIDDKPIEIAGRTFKKGDRVVEFTIDSELLYKFKGVYETFPGYTGEIQDVRRYVDLPVELRYMHEKFEEKVGAKFGMISTGPKTEDIVFVP